MVYFNIYYVFGSEKEIDFDEAAVILGMTVAFVIGCFYVSLRVNVAVWMKGRFFFCGKCALEWQYG